MKLKEAIKRINAKIAGQDFDLDYVIDFLVVVTGQKCTLKCKNCGNFSPYHSSKNDFYKADKIINDIKRITKKINSINRLQLQGGDFFLHKDAKKILQYVKNNNKILKCVIAANCIIIPKQEILDILKNEKFILRISPYGITNEVSQSKYRTILEKNNINYKIHTFAKREGVWSDLGGINISKNSKKKTLLNYKKCTFKVCLTLENGIIGRCSRATVAHKVQNFQIRKQDIINVRSPLFVIDELKKYIESIKTDKGVVSACYYCNGTSAKSIPAGEQLSKDEVKIANEYRRKNDR